MKKNIFTGLITALITPFKDGKIDSESLEKLIALQIKSGVCALVIGGTTGEGSSLDEDDYYNLIKLSTKLAGGKISIIAGVTTISTQYAVDKVRKISKLGIDGIMCTPPHYIRPTQDGILAHFKMVHDSTDLPFILYSNLGRIGVDFSDETIIKLAENPRIIAFKDCGSDITRPLRLLPKLPKGFNMLTGDDPNCVAYSAHGGAGCASVVSNILPNECLLLQNYLASGDFKQALALQQKLLPIYEAIFTETNPIGIKCAASLLNLCSDEIKLPLTKAHTSTHSLIEKILREFGKI